jgi:uncharacterized protein YecA (UPF0149 family)
MNESVKAQVVIDLEVQEQKFFLITRTPEMDIANLMVAEVGPKRNPRLRELTARPSNKFRNQPCSCGSGKKAKKCCKK